MKYAKIELPNDFEKGHCSDCPFSYVDRDLVQSICVFYCRYDECPIEIEEDEE